jgi:hypothetical protein
VEGGGLEGQEPPSPPEPITKGRKKEEVPKGIYSIHKSTGSGLYSYLAFETRPLWHIQDKICTCGREPYIDVC